MDVALQPGVDFVERISSVVAACHVLLVVIGPDWARPADGQAHARITDPDDFVGLEVGTALGRTDVTVIPLLVDGGSMPDPDELPEKLRPLTRRNALELSNARWHYDVGRLMDLLEQLLTPAPQPTVVQPPAMRAVAAADSAADEPPDRASKPLQRMRRHARALTGVAGVVVMAVLALILAGGGSDPAVDGTAPTVTGSSIEIGARPAGVVSGCKDRGETQLAKDVEALRQWDCPTDEMQDVTGAALTYLDFAGASEAHRSFIGSRDFELGHGWRSCGRAFSDRLQPTDTREAWCLRSTEQSTVEIYWHDDGSSAVGLLTCDAPTTIEHAVSAWLDLA